MKSSERTQWLLRNVARLRRSQQRHRHDPDLAAIRVDLELELGETVSRRAAARFLGVSHAALDRWIDRGDIPLVPTPNGRTQVPVGALLVLRERVEEKRVHGDRRRHHLEAVLKEDHERAERMRPERYVPNEDGSFGHQRAERRGLAYHRVVAARLTGNLVDDARQRALRWIREGRLDHRYGERWLELLSEPIPVIKEAIVEDSRRGRDLRQSSPFAGALTGRERRRLLEAVG
ncbi:MAG: hypothetical protein BroJett022_06490 [Actinomycetes bacterium]|nr:MAG: hypothetical protein BroJett022_06490 [Actinomycetes bacterium]